MTTVRIFTAKKNCRKLHLAGPYAILAGLYVFFRPCSRYRVRPSYRDFASGLLLKARAGLYGSYALGHIIISDMYCNVFNWPVKWPCSEMTKKTP